MNELDKERERIGRLLENGYMTHKEHRRLTRAIDREAAKRAKAEAETQLMLARAATRKAYRDTVLRTQLKQSLERDA